MIVFDIEASQVENFERWKKEHDEQVRADEKEKVLEGFEKYYINAEPEECATCEDVEPYGCFKCLLKKYKEQE